MSTVAQTSKIEFFFVGVGKCGTSWIFEIARKKNLFSVPKIKEPYLIDQPPSRREKLTKSLYRSFERMADFSNLYYWDPDNSTKIFSYNPNAKIIFTVRKPSQRIVSNFKFMKRNGDFSNVSLPEYLDSGDPIDLVARSDYRHMIERYTSVFGADQVLVLALEHLKADPQNYLDRLTDFCGTAQIILSEEDKVPVLQQAHARSSVAAKLAKQTAITLRKFGLLSLLGILKDSKLVRKSLYSEQRVQPLGEDFGFGKSEDAVSLLDNDYIELLKDLNYTIPEKASTSVEGSV